MPNHAEMARKAIRRQKQRGRPTQQSLETALDRIAGNGEADVEDASPSEVEVLNVELKTSEAERDEQLAPYQDGLPFDLERIKQRILDCGVNILEEMVTIGKYLVWAKEELGHGNFVGWLEDDLGMSKQRAWEFMRVSQRVIESKSPLARTFLRAAAGDTKKKLLALIDVSDEEIEEAMETETFLGRDLDEISAMGYRQLQDALREEKERNQILRDRQEMQERKLKKTQAELERIKEGGDPEPTTAQTLLEQEFARALNVLGKLERISTEFAEEYGDEGLAEPEIRDMVGSYLRALNQKTTSLYTILTPEDVIGERWHIRAGMDLADFPIPLSNTTPTPDSEDEES